MQEPTRGKNILDHILVSEDLKEVYDRSCVTIESPMGNSDHATLVAAPLRSLDYQTSARSQRIFDLRKSNVENLLHKASQFDWFSVADPAADINIQWASLYATLQSLLTESIPQREVIMTNRDKQWMTPITKLVLDQKWEAYRRKDWKRFLFLKEKAKTEIRKAKSLWTLKMKQRPDGLWKLTRVLSGRALVNDMDGLLAQYPSPGHLAEAVAEHNRSNLIVDSSDYNIPGLESTVSADWLRETFDAGEITNQLRRLKPSKSPGIDNIPNTIYSILAYFLAIPLKTIFDTSIQQKVFPTEWKKGIVVPIPKTRPPLLHKLRLITLLPEPAKILERMVLKKVIHLLEPLYGANQHAFRRGTSTTTAIIELLDTITAHFDNPRIPAVGVLSLDFSKAFDMVDHSVLLRKVSDEPKLRGFAQWLLCYLSGRQSVVRISGSVSGAFPIGSGVPQGSVLGPCLFSVLVGDLPGCSIDNNTFVQFADDVNIVIPVADDGAASIHSSIKKQLTQVNEWCRSNKQVLNLNKSKLMLIARKPTLLPEDPFAPTSTMKVLGVHLSADLRWNNHICDATRQASQRMHVLRTLKPHTTCWELHAVYEALIGSIYDYCCPAFVKLPKVLCAQIRRIQRRAHRIIFGDENRCNCIFDGFEKRRESLSLKLLGKILNNPRHILHARAPKRLIRSQNLTNFYCRTSKRQHTFFPHTTLLHNFYHNSLS